MDRASAKEGIASLGGSSWTKRFTVSATAIKLAKFVGVAVENKGIVVESANKVFCILD